MDSGRESLLPVSSVHMRYPPASPTCGKPTRNYGNGDYNHNNDSYDHDNGEDISDDSDESFDDHIGGNGNTGYPPPASPICGKPTRNYPPLNFRF